MCQVGERPLPSTFPMSARYFFLQAAAEKAPAFVKVVSFVGVILSGKL